MAKDEPFTLRVSIAGPTTYAGDIVAYTFRRDGTFVNRAVVKKGTVRLPIGADQARSHRVLFGPPLDEDQRPSIQMLRRISAFEAVLTPGDLIDHVRIPGTIVDVWPLCFCWVTGRVLKDDRPVCDARVHICEVDRVDWIVVLPDRDLFRLRDDLLKVLREPPKFPSPRPQPDPSPFVVAGGLDLDLDSIAFNPQPEPLSPRFTTEHAGVSPLDLLPASAQTALASQSATTLRKALVEHFELLHPYICLMPFWWRYRCDEISVVTTDASGRFSVLVPYNCLGDKLDIYVWVEFEIGGVLETIYRPPIACNTYWNYACGTDITINITDPRGWCRVCGGNSRFAISGLVEGGPLQAARSRVSGSRG